MKLNRSNYELWFIDYTDGKLSPSQKEELFRFLEQHPDLKEEFELFTAEEVRLEVPKASFADKSALKKSAEAEVTMEQLVAFMENDLSAEERLSVAMRVESDESKSRDLALLKKTRLQPDKAIVYPSRSQLKRGLVISIRPMYRYAAIAASLIFLLAAYAFFRNLSFHERSTAESTIQPAVSAPEKKTLPLGSETELQAKKTTPNVIDLSAPSGKNNSLADANSVQKKTNGTSPAVIESSAPKAVAVNNKNEQLERAEEHFENQVPSPTAVQSTQNLTLLAQDVIKKSKASNSPFTQEELTEFEADKKNTEEKPLEVLAQKSLKRIKDAADITIEEKEDVVEDSKTFAMAIGKRFSFSRTKSN